MLLSLLSVAVSAAEPAFRVYFKTDKASYAKGDTVVAELYIQRTDADSSYLLYNFTDYVVFNSSFLTYIDGAAGPADFRLESGKNGGMEYDGQLKFVSIRYQYTDTSAVNTPASRPAALLAATLRFKATDDCQTPLQQKNVEVWTDRSGGGTVSAEDATIIAGTPKYYSVSYSGGTGATGSVAGMNKVAAGTSLKLPANGFAKSGKTFGGWFDGTNIYSAGSSYYLTADTTFRAVWKPIVITYAGGQNGDVQCVSAANVRVLSGGTADPGAKLTFTAAPAKGFQFSGWSDGSSENPRVITVFEDVNLTAKFTAPGGSASGGSVPVVVDGTEYDIGQSTVAGDTTTVTVDQSALQKQLDSAKASVVIPISADTGTVEASLVVENVETMAQKNMILSVRVGNVSYEMPAAAVDTAALMKAVGAADPSAVPFTVTISQLPSSAVTVTGGTLLMPPVSFTVTASYNGKTSAVSVFTKYVARVITVPSGVDAAQITTAVVAENGTERHVPTDVYYENGVWYARINSLTNSVYALIYNRVSFTDAAGAWYERIVNEMASRRVINGVGGGRFEGKRNITRAEFASIIVKALGLPENGSAGFSDVSASAWYAGAVGTAAQYGIVNGYSDGTFRPGRMITRQEAMAMIARAAKITGWAGSAGTLSGFSDAGAASEWAKASVEWNVGSGIIVGTNGMLHLNSNITRAETAAVVLRLLQRAGLIDIRTRA